MLFQSYLNQNLSQCHRSHLHLRSRQIHLRFLQFFLVPFLIPLKSEEIYNSFQNLAFLYLTIDLLPLHYPMQFPLDN